jgi:hypothetical protein
VGELDTDFTDEVMKKFMVDLRKKTATRWSLDVVPEEMLEVLCTLDAGERKSGVLFNNAVYFLPNYSPGQVSRASGV